GRDLSKALQERLPDYMLPAAVVVLPDLPLTSAGKVDLRALPLIETRTHNVVMTLVEPRTALEAIIADRWKRLLGQSAISVDDNFFELGGHSLQATRLVGELQNVLPTDVPLLTLFFENPTVAGLARAVSDNLPSGTDIE